MPSTLYLCEKPSQARDIGRVLGAVRRREGYLEGQGVCVTWCLGHLLEMVAPDDYKPEWRSWNLDRLPMIPETWQLGIREGGSGQLKIIKKLLRATEAVVLATDADREGETIGREVLEWCRYRGRVSRLWLSALDEKSIRKALDSLLPGHQSEPLYQAGLGRARADWLVGMNLSRAYTLWGRYSGHDGLLTVGRVQTPTLKLVVDRDRLIENFRPVAFTDLTVRLAGASGAFPAKWIPAKSIADEAGRCLDRSIAEAVATKVAGKEGEILKAETTRVRESPPLPLDLSTLQVEASRRWGMGAKKCLDLAQSLYERHKAITYPRSDCRYLPVSQFPDAPDILKAVAQTSPTLEGWVGQANPTLRSQAWNDARITAHHAIIPTGATVRGGAFSTDEARLFDLIGRHYLAQFFPHFEYDRTVVDATVEEESFRATGRVEIVAGWRPVVGKGTKPDRQEEDADLPPVLPGETVRVDDTRLEDKKSQPPPRYTEGTLIQAMKSVGKLVDNPRLRAILRQTSGIGTEATRATIIENLLKRQLLLREGKKQLLSSPAGRLLVDGLPTSVTDPATTAVWEQTLDDIAQGRGSLEEFLGKSTAWVSRLVANVKARQQLGLRMRLQTSGEHGFGENDTQRPADFRESGTQRPADFRENGTQRPAEGSASRGASCPHCHKGTLVIRTAKKGGNSGKQFLGCSLFPGCRFLAPLTGAATPLRGKKT
ncbi:MAG: DNA topoisomerase III [Magnetococcales bacterium]|nr:DNA topoisomerase III [Magnetococcales bacterium]